MLRVRYVYGCNVKSLESEMKQFQTAGNGSKIIKEDNRIKGHLIDYNTDTILQ